VFLAGFSWTFATPVAAQSADYIDTEPFIDGWGWNGVESCITEQSPIAGHCIDTDPVGDGVFAPDKLS